MSLIWPAWISSPFKPSPVKIEDYILAGLRDENTGYNYWLLLTWHVFIKEEQSMISTCILWRIILAIFSFLHFLHNLRAIFYSLYWRALRRKWNLERKPIMDGQYILPCFPSSPPLLEEKIRKEVAVSHYEGKRVGQEQHLEQESIRLLIFSPFPLMDSWKLFLNEGLAWRFALPTSPFIDGAPGSYQRLDLFNRLLRVLCPNLTDASTKDTTLSRPGSMQAFPEKSSSILQIPKKSFALPFGLGIW